MRTLLTLVFIGILTATQAQLSADKYISLARNDIQDLNYTLAIQRLNFAIKTKPYSVEAYFLRAMAKYSLEDYNGAVIDYSHCLSLTPNNSGVYQNRGLARAKGNDHYGAIDDFEKSIKYDPGNYFSYLNLAYSQLQIKQFEEVIPTCDRAISLNEYLDGAYLIRGIAYGELEKYDQAIEDFGWVIKIDPNNSEAYLRRAMVYNDILEYSKAILDCDSAISIDSTTSMGYFVKANIYAERLKYSEAISFYDKVIELNPQNAMAYFNRANVETRMDNYKKAAYDYKRVTEINPNNIIGHFNLALTYHKLDRLDLALESYNRVIEIYPDMEDAWFSRAFIKKELGDEKGAQLDFSKGNQIRAKNKSKTFDYDEKELLQKFTEMDADFYRPNFNEEEEQIAVFTFPFFELKETEYKNVNNNNLYYNINQLTTYNEKQNNSPFFYLSTPLLNTGNQVFSSKKDSSLTSEYEFLHEAIVLKSEFDFNASIATYNSLIFKYPDFSFGYFNKASTMLDLLELMLKLEAGTGKFMKLGEEFSAIQLSDVQTLNVQLDEIEKLYLKSLEIDPEFYFTWFNIGIVRAEKRDFEGSIDAYNNAIKINPEFAEAYYNKGLTYLYLKNNKRACNELSKAGELGIKDAYLVMKKYCK
ncbi:MAG: tetratricopeptide repeat protein [Salibacteraceae bacterium]